MTGSHSAEEGSAGAVQPESHAKRTRLPGPVRTLLGIVLGKWWGFLGLGILIPVLCCGGGLAASTVSHSIERRHANTELTRYLERIQRGDEAGAERQLCIDMRTGEGYPGIEETRKHHPDSVFTSFSIGVPAEFTGMDGTYLVYPVRLGYPDGTTQETTFTVGLETGGPKICDSRTWR